jgi:hypothetical protein
MKQRWYVLMATLMVAGLAGCDSSTEPIVEDREPVAAEVYDRATGELLAYTHGTGSGIHWDGGIPHLSVSEEIALDVVFLDDDGEVIPLGGAYEVRARLADDSPENVIEFSNHGDHIDVEAVGPGTASVVLMFYHDGHSEWDAPPLAVHVEVEGGEPVAAEVRNRDTGELLVETEGSGASIHWDGDFPQLTVGAGIEVDVIFFDVTGTIVPLVGDYEVRLALAEGAATGIIDWTNHGDHIDIGAEAAGTTTVIFEFWHDDHADWATPGLDITVVDP